MSPQQEGRILVASSRREDPTRIRDAYPALDETAARSRVLNRVESSGAVEVTPVAGAGIAVRVR